MVQPIFMFKTKQTQIHTSTHIYTQILIHKDKEIQRYRDTDTHRYRDRNREIHKDTEIEV